ncbi:hypothetical protein Hamer_G017370 [Homarus americanus]|uniref:Uncharacterized protein n=1 Tax=Homarus americanus TaxID=6706 RepID=A0A8J5JJY8_HOMAM|nr:hypothetical protein Hamer_G017370 [Homarus americanus]
MVNTPPNKPRSRSLDTASLHESGVRLLRLRLSRRHNDGSKSPRAAGSTSVDQPKDMLAPRKNFATPLRIAAWALRRSSSRSPRSMSLERPGEGPWVNQEALSNEVVSSPYRRRHSLTPTVVQLNPPLQVRHNPQLLPCHRHPEEYQTQPAHAPTPYLVDGYVQNFYSSEDWRAVLDAEDRGEHPSSSRVCQGLGWLNTQPDRPAPLLPPTTRGHHLPHSRHRSDSEGSAYEVALRALQQSSHISSSDDFPGTHSSHRPPPSPTSTVSSSHTCYLNTTVPHLLLVEACCI